MDHTSHHPPVDHFLIDARNYTMHGYYEVYGNFSGVINVSLIGGFRGRSFVEFGDG